MKYLKTYENRLTEAEEVDTKIEIAPEDYKEVNDFLDDEYQDLVLATGESGVPTKEKLAKIDDKVKAILNMGRKDNNVKDEIVAYSTPSLTVRDLKPTQSQIGFLNSIGYVAFVNPEGCRSSLSGNADFGGGAILTSDGEYILDGHHRWSGVFMINPNAKIPCVNLNLGLDDDESLKVVQLAIAAEYGALLLKPANSETDIFNDEITGKNGEKLREMLTKIFNGDYGTEEKDGGKIENVQVFKNILKEAWNTDEEGVMDKLVQHAKMIKATRPEGAPPRGIMPQPSDTAGALGRPKKDGPGGMPKDVFNKLASGDLNFRKPVEPVVDNYNQFVKKKK